MENASEIVAWILIAACVGSGIMAGLFCSLSVFMMKALASLPDENGIRAMQAINRFIVRPSFLLVFFGTGLLCVLAVVLLWNMPATTRLTTLSAAGAYIFGCLAVTMVFNVPLNNQLDAVDAESEAGRALWQRYLVTWTQWNHLRSLSTLISTFLLAVVLVQAF